MSANFTPVLGGYREPGAFKFWCQKVLPLVYDDSLSYYELLCKVVDYINNLVHDNSLTIDKVEQLEAYVNNYFDNLDVTQEISDKLDEMASDGTLTEIVQPILNELSQYLVEQSRAQQTYNEETRANTSNAILSQNAYNAQTRDQVSAMVGHPFTASSAVDMTDTSKIYVYTGTTTSSFTNGHWYYWDGSAWTDGGVYNASAVDTDTTLSVSGAPADALVTGNNIRALKDSEYQTANLLPKLSNTTVNGVTLTYIGNGKYTLVGTCSADTNITFYSDASSLPEWMQYGKKYYGIIDGAVSDRYRLIVANNPGYSIIARVNNALESFTSPLSNGVLIALNIDGGVTYSETFSPVLLADTYFTNLYMPDKGISLVVNRLPELSSITVNGLTLTNVGNGEYTLVGTASADTNITFFTDAGNVPDWLKRGFDYYIGLLGVKSIRCRLLLASRPGYAIVAEGRNNLARFTMPTTGGVLVALNIDGDVTYNERFTPVIIADSYFSDIYMPKREVIVSPDGKGDFTTIKSAIEYANRNEGTTIRVYPGVYDLVAEFGDTYLDALSDSNPDYGLYLGNNVNIICSPLATIKFDYDGDNEWVVRHFSPFNTANKYGYTVDGMHVTARNCRYIVHDDPLWEDKMNFSHNVWKNCYFEIYPSPQVASWVNHQIIGGGFGYNNLIEIDSCIFNAHYSGVTNYSSLSYHNDVSGQTGSRSRLTVKNCYFADGNRIILEGYGASTVKSEVVINGNCLKNASADIIYDSSNADNMIVYQFNNQSR